MSDNITTTSQRLKSLLNEEDEEDLPSIAAFSVASKTLEGICNAFVEALLPFPLGYVVPDESNGLSMVWQNPHLDKEIRFHIFATGDKTSLYCREGLNSDFQKDASIQVIADRLKAICSYQSAGSVLLRCEWK